MGVILLPTLVSRSIVVVLYIESDLDAMNKLPSSLLFGLPNNLQIVERYFASRWPAL